ncbi:MAG: hypothetical protein FWD17_16640, partial [Polyangiaceae bacterium]|nr:hypothetical protein [Polyangiaceae bacterium]
MKTEDTGPDAGGSPTGAATSNGAARVNGTGATSPESGPSGATSPAAEGAEPYRNPRTVADLPQVKRSRWLRWAYWTLWFGIVPIVLSWLTLWAFSPTSAVEANGVIGWIQSAVRSQPVPVGIVLFTWFEGLLWAARLYLPFAQHAHPAQRADLPSNLRGQFERARVLLDEADSILARHAQGVVRELTAKERDRLGADLDELRTAMVSVPFDEDGFI